MMLELMTLVSVLSFLGSMQVLLNLRKQYGKEAPRTSVVPVAHAVCSKCKCTVAKYENKNDKIVCENCKGWGGGRYVG